MLKMLITILAMLLFVPFVWARTNAEIGAELYKVANITQKNNLYTLDAIKNNIATFLIEANLIGFNEDKAKWQKLNQDWVYDKSSVSHLNHRHVGVYKSMDGYVMGVFDINCEDENDINENYYGYVETIEVYFKSTNKNIRGHSKGLYKTFCK